MKIAFLAALRAFAITALWLGGAGVAGANCPPIAGNPQIAPDAGYTDHGDGTVTDSATGLMWAKCTQGQSVTTCTGSPTFLNWSEALTAADTATLAGHTDWRLPNINELQSLVETGCFSPSINSTLFPGTQRTFYWSSTTYNDIGPNYARGVNFQDGKLGHYTKDNFVPVRLVRGGRWFDTFSSAADFTPQAFTFADQTGVALNSVIESAPITLADLTTVTGIKVTGGEYSLNGGAYTTAPGVAKDGDMVQVRHISGSDHSASVDTELTVGGVSDTFTSTTLSLADDIIFRDAFEAPSP